MNQFIIPVILASMMFGMGMSLTTRDFGNVLLNKKPILIGSLCQIVLLPVLGWSTVWLFSLDAEWAVGTIILICCAGGVVSNSITYIAKGDAALSVVLTTLSMCIGLVTIPLMINFAIDYFYQESSSLLLPTEQVAGTLFLILLLPLVLGMLARRQLPVFARSSEVYIRRLSAASLTVMCFVILFSRYDEISQSMAQIGVAIFALNTTAMMLSYGISRAFQLTSTQRTAVVIEVSIQNSATGIFIASNLIGNLDMALPSIIYTAVAFINVFVFLTFRSLMNVPGKDSKCSFPPFQETRKI